MSDEKGNHCIFAPPQKDMSVNPLLDAKIGSLDFVPHFLILYWSLNDYFTFRYQLLTDGDKSAIESLKGSSSYDAAWIACHMGQQPYGLSMIEYNTDGYSYLLKSVYKWTKPYTPPDKIQFEPNSVDDKICFEYTKCSRSTQEKISETLQSTIKTITVMCHGYMIHSFLH